MAKRLEELKGWERWVKIKDFSRYSISSKGRVRIDESRHASKKGKILKPRLGGRNKNYHRVSLSNERVRKKDFYIHRLVLSHFVGEPCSEKPQCAHLDGDPSNNNIENLKWVDNSENQKHRFEHGTHGLGEKNPMSKLFEKDVKNILKSSKTHAQLAKEFKVSVSTISDIRLKKRWSHL